jgi:hypothetical protein
MLSEPCEYEYDRNPNPYSDFGLVRLDLSSLTALDKHRINTSTPILDAYAERHSLANASVIS